MDDRQAILDGGAASAPPSAILTAVWESMAEVLGTAATATLLRRAAIRAADRMPALARLEISRDNLVRYYKVPDTWRTAGEPHAFRELEALLEDLRPLLIRLTGQILVRRVDAIVSELSAGRERGSNERR